MASSSWDRVGQAASVMQVTGVDAFGLVNMIVQAAHTARRNRDLCQQLAQHVLIVADLLRKLDIPALRQHLETRRPLELLDAALFRAYKLVRSCAQRQENTSQIYQMFTGAEVASKLRLAQEEIDRYINLIPMITLVAAVGARQATNEVHEDGSNDAAPTQSRLPEICRNRLSLQHVTQSLTLEELQPQGSSIDMEARRNGREARRNAWQVVTQNVYNGMFHQMGRYLTYGGTHKSTGSVLFSICFVNKNDFSILCTREKW
ncbi:protein MID1-COMPLEMENTING ACTIVITY 1-like isoform X6 [Miscanthus floridulus]|uniref:protein MID1-COMPLEMENTING ACTIVITY 1-like isoform X6 n=1 Tax=Miscanthus floridulus TaxID=154761 RepID=UPI003458A4FE